MKMNLFSGIAAFILMSFIVSCTNGPKKIEAIDLNVNSNINTTGNSSTGIFDSGSNQQIKNSNEPVINSVTQKGDARTIEVLEVLPTDKYVYLKSKEGDEEFWVAVIKQEVSVGDKYFFKGGLLKTNFESKEYNRVFDKVYLVSRLIPVDPQKKDLKNNQVKVGNSEQNIKAFDGPIKHKEGSITIKALTDNPEKYNNKKIQLTGKCVKLNPNIMGRNWIHLQDDTNNDYDLVVTMDVAVPVGHVVTVSGMVTLNKDFGAGYKYDLIVENGELIR